MNKIFKWIHSRFHKIEPHSFYRLKEDQIKGLNVGDVITVRKVFFCNTTQSDVVQFSKFGSDECRYHEEDDFRKIFEKIKDEEEL